MPSDQSLLLSKRGTETLKPDGTQFIWEAMKDAWHPKKNPNGMLSLGIAENALMHPELTEYFNKNFHLTAHNLTYGDGSIGSTDLRAAIASFITRHFKSVLPVKSDQIVATHGVTTAIEACSFIFCNEGDGILLGRPYYAAFKSDMGWRARVKAVEVAFRDVDPFSFAAVDKYEETLVASEAGGVKIRALMLCSPHNPLGRCYAKESILAFLKLCQKYQIHFISDEIYALSVWHNEEAPDAIPFTSVLSLELGGTIDPSLVHVLWGFSKDFGANGLRIGCIVSQNNPEFLQAITRNSVFHYTSAPADALATTLLNDDDFTTFFIKTNNHRISAAYKFATGLLRKHDIPYHTHCNAAFFLWIDLKTAFDKVQAKRGALENVNSNEDSGHVMNGDIQRIEAVDKMLMDRLLAKGLVLASGKVYGGEKAGWYRMVFTQPQEMIEEGIRRIAQALE